MHQQINLDADDLAEILAERFNIDLNKHVISCSIQVDDIDGGCHWIYIEKDTTLNVDVATKYTSF